MDLNGCCERLRFRIMGIEKSKCNSITEKEIMKYDFTETWIVCTCEL